MTIKRLPVRLLLGPEQGQKDEFIATIKNELFKEYGSSLEELKFFPFDQSLNDLVLGMQNASLFSTHKLVIIRQCETIKGSDAQILADYCKKPSPDTTLLLISRAGTRDIAAKISSAVPKDAQKIFWEMFEDKKHSWLSGFFKSNNISLEPGAEDLILEIVENNTNQLEKDCRKLVIYFGKGSYLTKNDVEEFLWHSREENVFSLFERFVNSGYESVLETLHKILESGDSQHSGLLGGFLWQVKRLRTLTKSLKMGMQKQSALKDAGINGKKNTELYLKAAKRYSFEQQDRIILLVAEFEARIRQGQTHSQTLLLELFFYYSMCKNALLPDAKYFTGTLGKSF